jgi:hypothetical protein
MWMAWLSCRFPGQPVDPPVAGGHLDRGGAVVGGELVPGREPADVADEAEHRRGDDRSDAVEVGQGGFRRRDQPGQPPPGVVALLVDVAQIFQQ